jgi:hypothetical protein
VLGSPTVFHATSVLQMNIEELYQRADKVFRGKVVDTSYTTMEVGGGQLPVVSYRILVDDPFKGEYPAVGDVRVIDVRMINPDKSPVFPGNPRRTALFRDLPRLEIGQEYVLFTTVESSLGLSTTVGLAQGCFRVEKIAKRANAVNGLDNVGLFRGIDTANMPSSGPILYPRLARFIRQLAER